MNIRLVLLIVIKNCVLMDELLIFTDNETGDRVGMYYNTWLFIIKCILIKYAHKNNQETDEILKNIIIRNLKIIMM